MMFDYRALADEVGLEPDDLRTLEAFEELEYPGDPMMQELRISRSLRAVRERRLSVDDLMSQTRSEMKTLTVAEPRAPYHEFRYRYSPETVEKSRKLYTLLVSSGRAARAERITYGEVARLLSWHVRPLRFALHKVQDECLRTNRPPLTALVVKSTSLEPSTGCVVSSSKELDGALKRVSVCEWPGEPWW